MTVPSLFCLTATRCALLFFISLAFVVSAGTRAVAASPAPPAVTATAAIAIDVDSGRIFYAKDMHRRLPMASTTKIMTALTALNIAGFNMDEKATVVKDDLVGEASMGLRENEQLSLHALLFGLLLNSGNDAAMTIARHMGAKLPGGGDPIARFVAQMNANAAAWGLRNTHYVNPHGLDTDGHYSSAFDLAIAGWHALHTPLLAQIMSTRSIKIEGHNLVNINTFLTSYPGANGVKPGLTDAAGLCLVASAQHNGHYALVVILNTSDMHGDANGLMNYSFARMSDVTDNSTVSTPDGTFSTALDHAIGTVKNNTLVPFKLDTTGRPLPLVSAATIINAATAPNFPQAKSVDAGNLGGGPVVANLQDVPTDATPTTTDTSGTGSNGSSGTKQSGGGIFGFLLVLLGIVILGAVIYTITRRGLLGPAWQERAGRFGDGAGQRFNRARSALVERARARRSEQGPPPPENQRQQPRPDASENTPQRPPERNYPRASQTQPQVPPMAQTRVQTPTVPNAVQPRPLQPNDYDSAPTPPMPLTSRSYEQPRPTPSARVEEPSRATNRPLAAAGDDVTLTDGPAERESKQPTRTSPLGEQVIDEAWLANRARQAIAYTAAGRYQAGFDEFRRVVENAPLFDFGGMPEFEDMSLVGYRALAQAYLHVGRPRFAVLLLEMAIERYPNDLELRSGLRNLKKELGML